MIKILTKFIFNNDIKSLIKIAIRIAILLTRIY